MAIKRNIILLVSILFLVGFVNAASSGGTITTILDGGLNYTIHTFTSNGTFVADGVTNVSVLVVAGGAGGGSGGGGAGGLIYNNSYIVSGSTNVVIGTGGAAGSVGATGSSGQNSTFGTLIAVGGGGGGGAYVAGNPGGSGGGASRTTCSNLYAGGLGVSGQGNNGGTGGNWCQYQGAGGGGAGAVGGNIGSGTAGNGGNGLNYSINGTNVYYAGGGGGSSYYEAATRGTGGSGGGGNGAGAGIAGVSGINGTGGGGGGGSSYRAAGAGGSGVVIVRYLTIPSMFNIYSPANDSIQANTFTLNFTMINSSSLWYYNGSANVTYIAPIQLNRSAGNYSFVLYGNLSNGTTFNYSLSFSVQSNLNLSFINSIVGTGGNATLVQDGPTTYAINKFTSSGTFVPPVGVTDFSVLIVAGGGGGGMDMGGGGGGGGVIYNDSFHSTSSSFPVVVGAGGNGGPAGGTNGQPGAHQFTIGATNGGNSSFGGMVAIGGGAGGSSYYGHALGGRPSNGGSGGGASGYSSGGLLAGGIGVSSQGNNGGRGGGQYYSGGGGGAGSVGADSPSQPNGGAGVLNSILGTPYYWGGGGGGGAYTSSTGGNGGIGGGGGGAVGTTVGGVGLNNGSAGGGGSPNSQTNKPGGNAGNNTGGGGGGSSHYNSNNKGGDGGYGIVVVRHEAVVQTVQNNSGTNKNYIYANVSISGSNFSNITYNLYDESFSLLNSTTYTSNTSNTINWTNIVSGVYYYNVSISNIFGDVVSTETRKITLDSIVPNLTLISPTNLTTLFTRNWIFVNTSWTEANFYSIVFNLYNGSTLVNRVTSYSTIDSSGGIITTDGAYTVHTFTSNGTFVPPTGVTNVSVLVVAGGGGGGPWIGGGGGGGGVIYNDSYVVSGSTNVVIGVGGTGGSVSLGGTHGTNGANSTFGTLTAIGGGGGGGYNSTLADYTSGNNGGSGGAGGYGASAGNGTVGQGNNAGLSCLWQGGAYVAAGGGGGAGGVGTSCIMDVVPGNGGNGTNYTINGSNAYYGGGGGGGKTSNAGAYAVGGLGGGGRGGTRNNDDAVAGINGTGGGGGGGCSGSTAYNGKDGGSGVVIVRYLTPTAVSSGSASVNWTNIADGTNYSYFVNITDVSGNKNSTGVWYAIVDANAPNSSSLTPTNATLTFNQTHNFSVNVNDSATGIANITLNIYNQTGLYNQTVIADYAYGTLTATVGVVVNLVNGVYTWFYSLFDWTGNSINSANRTIYIGPNLYACQDLNEAGSYVLQNDVYTTGTCFNINVNNIILDGNGFAVDGNDAGTDYGILITNKNNITIKNFSGITDFYNGIHIASSSNVNVSNVAANSNVNDGIYLSATNSSTFTNVTVNSNQYGIYFDTASNSNSFNNINSDSNSVSSAYLYLSNNNRFVNGTMSSSGACVTEDCSDTECPINNYFENITMTCDGANDIVIERGSTNVGTCTDDPGISGSLFSALGISSTCGTFGGSWNTNYQYYNNKNNAFCENSFYFSDCSQLATSDTCYYGGYYNNYCGWNGGAAYCDSYYGCYNYYDSGTCSSSVFQGCGWADTSYCSGDQPTYCSSTFTDQSGCDGASGCLWTPSLTCEGDQNTYCGTTYLDETSCDSSGECDWDNDGSTCVALVTCAEQSESTCGTYLGCSLNDYGSCGATIDCTVQAVDTCTSYGACSWTEQGQCDGGDQWAGNYPYDIDGCGYLTNYVGATWYPAGCYSLGGNVPGALTDPWGYGSWASDCHMFDWPGSNDYGNPPYICDQQPECQSYYDSAGAFTCNNKGTIASGCSSIASKTDCNTGTSSLCFWNAQIALSLNNTFFNVLYDSSSENVSVGSQLYRKWGIGINAIDQGSLNITNVSVSVTDSAGNLLSGNTGTSGTTSYFPLTEYLNNGTKVYMNNYSVSSTRSGFASNTTAITVSSSTILQMLLRDITAPTFSNVFFTPNNTDYVDPSALLNFSSLPVDNWVNISTAILQFCDESCTNYSTTRDPISGNFLATDIQLGASEKNYTFTIWANDSYGNANVSDTYSFESAWDCTWNMVTNMTVVAGWQENKEVGNVTLNNTGDAQFASNNCSLTFKLNHNLAAGRIYFDNDPANKYTKDHYVVSPVLEAGQTRVVDVNISFNSNSVLIETATIGATELEGISSLTDRSVSFSALSVENGPYLWLTDGTYPTTIALANGSVLLSALMQNVVADGSLNRTAYDVTFGWVLPDGMIISSGNQTINYTNITDPAYQTNELELMFNSTNLPSLSPTNFTFIVYAQGYSNVTGTPELITFADNSTMVSRNYTGTFTCNEEADGIQVPACGTLDGDYTAPSGETTGSSSGGGGGGGGGGGSFDKSSATFSLVRGENEEFELILDNKLDFDKSNIKITVTGNNSQYVSISPKVIDYLKAKSSSKIKVKITAPSYFSSGKFLLQFEFKGFIEGNTSTPFTEVKYITLEILEMSRASADSLVNNSQDILAKMNESGFYLKDVQGILDGMQQGYANLQFNNLKDANKKINEIYTAATESVKLMNEINASIMEAEKNGIPVSETKKLLYLAQIIFNRGDYINAYAKLKEAKSSLLLETKGEFNLLYAIKNNPIESLGILISVSLVSLGSGYLIRLGLLKRKLRILGEEEVLLLQLMRVVQKDCFEGNKMSMEEYNDAMMQYEKRLGAVIQDKIRTETQIANINKLSGKKKALVQEKDRLTVLVKQTQDDYMNRGKLDTRIYENMLRTYATRLNKIQEELAYMQAEDELKKVTGFWSKLFGKR